MSLVSAEFVSEARREFLDLPKGLQRQLRDLTPYLLANPFRSYPWLQVGELHEMRGVWKFRLGSRRVFYTVDGSALVFVAISPRPPAYTPAARAELRRRLSAHQRTARPIRE